MLEGMANTSLCPIVLKKQQIIELETLIKQLRESERKIDYLLLTLVNECQLLPNCKEEKVKRRVSLINPSLHRLFVQNKIHAMSFNQK